ncbi:MAG TPA: amidase family protein [Allosphingosinicella sp.]|jgi:amidase
MRSDEYAQLDGLALAGLIRSGQVSRSEVMAAAQAAAEDLNPRLNFLVGKIEPHRSDDRPQAAFSGLPLLVKDIGLALAGVRQEMGSRLASGHSPNEDSEHARRLLSAGFVIFGRTATPELGSAFTTESRASGPTRNPWDMSRSPGGSSGGAAVAVASGVVPIAHAGDSAGSIRIPAHCCGVFGLKPTRGRNPVGPQQGEVNSGLTAVHVLTRSVRDSAAVLDSTAGPDPGCGYFAPPPPRPYLESVSRQPGPLRIGFSAESPLAGRISPQIRDSVLAAARLCEDLGHHVEAATIGFDPDEFVGDVETVWCSNMAFLAGLLEASTGRSAGPDTVEGGTLAMIRRGRAIGAEALLGALSGLNRFARSWAAQTAEYDIFLTGSFADVAPPLGAIVNDREVGDVNGLIRELLGCAPFTVQFNVTGQPAASIPLHMSSEGLPIAPQLVGRFAEEHVLLALCAQLEAEAPWRLRHPPVSAFGSPPAPAAAA